MEGPQGLREAIVSGPGLEVLFCSADRHPVADLAREHGVPVERVSDEVMGGLTSAVTPQGLVGVAPFVDVPLEELPEEATCVCVLDGVRDPANVGTVLRSAAAAGADAVVLTSSSVDLYNPKTVRASAGSLFHLAVVRGADVREAVAALRQRNLAVYATGARGEVDLYSLDLSGPAAFLFGDGAGGLAEEAASAADATVRVPVAGRARSLNLGAAATVCLFEMARQRVAGARLEEVVRAAAHDMRSPLTALKGFASTLLSRWPELGPDDRELVLRGILADVERVSLTVRSLTDAARLSAGTLESARDEVDVGRVVAELGSLLEEGGGGPPVIWAGEEVRVVTDRERLRAAVGAMLEAAAWWAQEGPIRATASHAGGELRVEVFRAATELSPTEAQALFVPGRAGKIGLFVARRVAEAQSGTVTAEVAGGLRLHLRIPVDSVGRSRQPPGSLRG